MPLRDIALTLRPIVAPKARLKKRRSGKHSCAYKKYWYPETHLRRLLIRFDAHTRQSFSLLSARSGVMAGSDEMAGRLGAIE